MSAEAYLLNSYFCYLEIKYMTLDGLPRNLMGAPRIFALKTRPDWATTSSFSQVLSFGC